MDRKAKSEEVDSSDNWNSQLHVKNFKCQFLKLMYYWSLIQC